MITASDAHLRQLINILYRRRELIIAAAATGAILAGLGGWLMPPRYIAKAQIVVDSQPAGVLNGQTVGGAPGSDELVVRTQAAALTSGEHLQRVLDSLAQDPEFRAPVPKGGTAGAVIDGLWKRFWAWLTGSPPPAEAPAATPASLVLAIEGSIPTMRDVGALSLQDLERRLRVYQEQASRIISITFASTSPERAATVANRTAEIYVEREDEQNRAYALRTLAWLDKRLPQVKNEVEQADAALSKYQAAHGLAGTGRAEAIDQQVADLNRQLAVAQSDFAARQARLARVHDLQHGSADEDALIGVLDSPALMDLRRQELALLQSKAELQTTLGEKHPKMQELQGQLEAAQQDLARVIGQAVDNMKNEAGIAGAQVRRVQQQLAAMQALGTDVHLRELQRDADASHQLYASLQQRQNEVREQLGVLAPGIRILSLATPPDRPNTPDPILFILPSLVAASIIGGLLAIFMERLDQGLRSERDLGDVLGIPCIGLVPRLRRIGRVRPHQHMLEQPFGVYTEAIRSVVAASQLAGPRRPPRAFLVSSSVPGEGKTTLAVSFAVCTALLGRRVLLVDLDFRHPTILREFGGDADKGVLDLLLDDSSCADAIQHIPGLGLDYLPICRRLADPLALFASERVLWLLNRLRLSYDCIVIDGPPLLAITEARLLAAMVDKVLFVVKWGATPRNTAQNALNLLRNQVLLDRNHIDLVGVVTQVDLKRHARYRHGDTGESFVKHAGYYLEAQSEAALARVDTRIGANAAARSIYDQRQL
jgi:succinoglycan biosynthesis transport protein ExoP